MISTSSIYHNQSQSTDYRYPLPGLSSAVDLPMRGSQAWPVHSCRANGHKLLGDKSLFVPRKENRTDVKITTLNRVQNHLKLLHGSMKLSKLGCGWQRWQIFISLFVTEALLHTLQLYEYMHAYVVSVHNWVRDLIYIVFMIPAINRWTKIV